MFPVNNKHATIAVAGLIIMHSLFVNIVCLLSKGQNDS